MNLPSFTMAAAVKPSRLGTSDPLPAKARANGVLARCDISPSRWPMSPVYMLETSDSRHDATVPRGCAGSSHVICAMLCGSSLSAATEMRVSPCPGMSYQVRGRSFFGFFSPPKRALMARSISAGSKSPTAMTAMRSGRYQSR